MIVKEINPNTREYFTIDKINYSKDLVLYQGVYDFIPVYPLYSMTINRHFTYDNQVPEAEFKTMLLIARGFVYYLVEFKFRFTINIFEDNIYEKAIKEFHKECKEAKETINPKVL